MTTRADFMDSVDLIKNKIIELTQERDQLRQRVADLEAQLAEAKDGGWTYVEDEMPPVDVNMILTIVYRDGDEIDETVVDIGSFRGTEHRRQWQWWDDNPISGDVIAYRPLPQPAPLRTAANAEEQGT